MTTLSKRRKALADKVDRNKAYAAAEALTLVKDVATAKFDESVDAAVNLGIDPKKSDQAVRGSVVLPAGTGKTVAVLHRTARLAREHQDPQRRILLTTFTTNLAPTLEDQLRLLAPDHAGIVDVTNLHKLARSICELPQGAIRSDKESVMRGVGHTLEERLRIEAEMVISMFMRRDKHTLGAAAFKAGNLKPDWPNHGL